MDTTDEWIAMAWAAREAAHDQMNAGRRARFESVKAIGERDLPPSTIHYNSNVMRFKSR